jgi:hypothetical protein
MSWASFAGILPTEAVGAVMPEADRGVGQGGNPNLAKAVAECPILA